MSIVAKIIARLRRLRCRMRWHRPAFDRSWGHDAGVERSRCLDCAAAMERTVSGRWRISPPVKST